MDAGRLRKPEQTQSNSAEVPLDKGSLGRQRLPAKAVRPWCRRSSADFGSPRTIFYQIIGHGRHALKNLDPRVGARLRAVDLIVFTPAKISRWALAPVAGVITGANAHRLTKSTGRLRRMNPYWRICDWFGGILDDPRLKTVE